MAERRHRRHGRRADPSPPPPPSESLEIQAKPNGQRAQGCILLVRNLDPEVSITRLLLDVFNEDEWDISRASLLSSSGGKTKHAELVFCEMDHAKQAFELRSTSNYMGRKLKLTLLLPEADSRHGTVSSHRPPPETAPPPPPPPPEPSPPARDPPPEMESSHTPEPVSPDEEQTQPPAAEKSRAKQLQKKHTSDIARFLQHPRREKRKSSQRTQVVGPSLQQLSSFDSKTESSQTSSQPSPSFYTDDGDDGSTVFQISSSSGPLPDLVSHIAEAAARPSKKPRLVQVPQQMERRRPSVVKPHHRPTTPPRKPDQPRADVRPPIKVQKRSVPSRPKEMKVRKSSRRR